MTRRPIHIACLLLLAGQTASPAYAFVNSAPVVVDAEAPSVDARPDGFPWAPGLAPGAAQPSNEHPAARATPKPKPRKRAPKPVRTARVLPRPPLLPPPVPVRQEQAFEAQVQPGETPHVITPQQNRPRVAPMDRRITVSVSGLPLEDAIRLVAAKGQLNIAIEDDLKQPVNIEFRNVKLGDALETLFTMGGVQAVWRGNIFAVVGRTKAYERGLLASNARVFTLKYASAARIAEFLNTTALTRPYEGTSNRNTTQQGNQDRLELAHADVRTNSVFVMGTPSDIALAERTIAALDRPLEQRIFKLDHANAVEVASLLNATIFNNGNKAAVTTDVRADVPSLTEGTGHNTASAGVQMDSVNGAIRSRTTTTSNIPIEAKQSVAVPDSRTNSVIVSGSHEMIELAVAMMPKLDRKLAQVAIEVEVVEVNMQDALDLGTSLGAASGIVSTALNPNAAGTNPGWSLTVDPGAPATSFKASIDALVKNQHARLLAHPTVIATDNSEAQIDIVDEVIKGTRLSNQGLVGANGQQLLTTEPIFGAAGVTLNILPQIGADGLVTLRLHPTVSSVRETQHDSANNPISLLSRRELLAQQIVVPSGRSLTLGGLTQTNRISAANRLPLLGDIPILGYLFGVTNNSNNNTELIITVTPKILPD